MARVGFVALALWYAFVIFGSVTAVRENASLDVWDWMKMLLITGVAIPAGVWARWRAVLWMVGGFVRDVPAP